MRISVFGLGYVGTVSAACLAEMGHHVVGVDVDSAKVEAIAAGRSPIVEDGLDEFIARGAASGRLRAVGSAEEAVEASDLALICVGTPAGPGGRPHLEFVERVGAEIGAALRQRSRPFTVVLRSTVPPGTTEERLAPALASGAGDSGRFHLAYQPEFLREGSAVSDFFDPPKTVVGSADPAVADRVVGLFADLPGPVVRTSVRVAEMVKYVDNAFHALKISFANEIGGACRALGIESHEVMDIFKLDRKLNLGPAYLRPGFAFGGSCLPKDLRALAAMARDRDVELPLLRAVVDSNDQLVSRALDLVVGLGMRRVGILGLSFKAETDDLRDSPMVEVAERLIGKGFDLAIHDRRVRLARLTGANKAHVQRRLPHLEALLHEDVSTVLDQSDVVLIGSHDPAYRRVVGELSEGQIAVDLARILERAPAGSAGYRSLV